MNVLWRSCNVGLIGKGMKWILGKTPLEHMVFSVGTSLLILNVETFMARITVQYLITFLTFTNFIFQDLTSEVY